MKESVAVILFSGMVFLSASCIASPPVNDNAEESLVKAPALLAAHNKWRRQVGVPMLSWSDDLEQQSIDWAGKLQKNGCFMEHSGPGENLFWASPLKTAVSKDGNNDWLRKNSLQQITEQQVVDSWASEKRWFTPKTNGCNAPDGETCSHYTQLVWRSTTEVGCGKAICTDHSQVWVCTYDPPGNMIGKKPY